MKKEKDMREKVDFLEKGGRLNMIGTAVLILLMFSYLLMTVYSSAALAGQTDIISNHPFEVVIAAGDIKLYLTQLRVRTERLLLHHEDTDIASVKNSMEELYNLLEQPMHKIKSQYLGDSRDVEALEDMVGKLWEEQMYFVEYTASPVTTDSEIEDYVTVRLQPCYNDALNGVEKIIAVAQEKKVGYGETAERLRRRTLAGSIVLMTLMVGALVVLQYLLWKQRRELVFRSRLFDDLSMSIDDTFLIRNAQTGGVSYCALNMKRVLGVSTPDGENGYLGIKPEDAEEMKKAVRNTDLRTPYEKIVEYTKPSREKRWMCVRIYKTANKTDAQVITVFSDRTDEILSRQALQDAMNSAEQANMAKSDFLSRMSHEIRTPLNAVIGMTAIAAACVKDTARVEDCLSKINFSSKHLLLLINDVLDMSKIESNKMIIQEEPFDIFQIVNGFVSTVYAQAKAKGIEFSEMMEGFGENTTFIGDSLRLNQILLNLSSNAIKFTEPGGKVRLEVSLLAARHKIDVIRFVLSDTGIGMNQEAIGRIFKPFEQADGTISKRYGGTGLGMSITKNLVTLMNGRIHIESDPGKGTSCTVDLPFRRGEDSLEEPDFENQGLCALIVDDEQQVCEQTCCLLGKIRIQPEWTMSGIQAVEMAVARHRENRDFDLCLIDWKMPDLDGIEVTRRIRRAVGEDIPIVMISAYDITEVEQEARQAGVNGFLPKPLYRSSVYAAIKEALESRERHSFCVRQGENPVPLAGMRLLMAEDNELNREIAEELLKMNGAQVRCAHDGSEALELFLASKPGEYDAILMDVQMPVMDGHSASRRIRASEHPMAKSIPIIAITANAFSNDIQAALEAGMNAHVSKPLDIGQLCRTLLKWVNKEE